MDVLMKHAPALERSLLPKDRQFQLCKTGGVLYGVSIRMICWEKVEDMSEAVVSGALPGRMTPAYAEKYVRKYLSEADAENNRVRIIGGELKEWIDALKMAKAVSTKVAIIAAGGKRMNIFSIREKNRYFRCSVPGVTDANIHLITEIDDPETVEEIRTAAPTEGGVFHDQFGSLSDFVQKIPPLFRK